MRNCETNMLIRWHFKSIVNIFRLLILSRYSVNRLNYYYINALVACKFSTTKPLQSNYV